MPQILPSPTLHHRDTDIGALHVSWDGLDVFFLEAPLWPDDLNAYAELCRRSPVPIAAGEWLSTRHEFVDLLDRAGVQVAQPDVGRVGGLTEARRVCDLARDRGRLIVPHVWKTRISVRSPHTSRP